jgi:hypothetical protein
MEWLPGASRASQPECDADRQIFTRLICQIYLTAKHLVTAAHVRLSRIVPLDSNGTFMSEPNQQIGVASQAVTKY